PPPPPTPPTPPPQHHTRLTPQAMPHPKIVGPAIATRPDCVPDDVLDLLESYAEEKYVCLELGLQSIHDRSLDWMNRGHYFPSYADAVHRCQGRNLDICVHVILGLPGENHADMMATAEVVAASPVHAVKIHNLHVVKDTPMEQMYERGEVPMFELGEYVQVVCDFLERLPPHFVIHRLNGDAPPDYLIAPQWCMDKHTLLNNIQAELRKRDSWQGKKWSPEGKTLERPMLKEGESLSLPLIQ
ncbi:MAG: TIGR01212 family radical SAM protein, partial [Gemmataceae bacterium]